MARKVPLLEVDMTEDDSDEPDIFKYRELMLTIAKTPKDARAGATFDEMRKTLPLLDALDEAEGEEFVILEDEWWRELRDKAKVHRFRTSTHELVEFMHVIEKAETVKAIELVKPKETKESA